MIFDNAQTLGDTVSKFHIIYVCCERANISHQTKQKIGRKPSLRPVQIAYYTTYITHSDTYIAVCSSKSSPCTSLSLKIIGRDLTSLRLNEWGNENYMFNYLELHYPNL